MSNRAISFYTPSEDISGGLSAMTTRFLQTYLQDHQGELPPPGVHERILREVEKPLIEIILHATQGNQKKAAEILGMNRNTLRKKLTDYGIEWRKA